MKWNAASEFEVADAPIVLKRGGRMEYTISLSENRLYVVLVVVGDVNRVSAMGMNIEAHIYGRERGISRFLVDMTRARNVESVTGNYRFS